jgi:lysophosphatidylcholine acyltransferase/lyso-PAF acetyltransferase
MSVEFLPVYVPSEHEKGGDYASAKLYGSNVRKVMRDSLGCATTEHSYEDVKLAGIAKQLQVPIDDVLPENGLGPLLGAQKLLGADVTLESIEKHLRTFAAMDSTNSGRVTMQQFATSFELDHTKKEVRSLFSLLDRDDSGSLDFKEYLFGLALVNESAGNRKQLIKLAFTVFDESGDGYLQLAELASLLAFNPEISTNQVAEIFKKADLNGDGEPICCAPCSYSPQDWLCPVNLTVRPTPPPAP